MHVGDKRKECCKPEAGNLGPVIRERHDVTFRRCRVCQCRHFEFTVDPIRVQAKMSGVGG